MHVLLLLTKFGSQHLLKYPKLKYKRTETCDQKITSFNKR